jgi:hypothetical protein
MEARLEAAFVAKLSAKRARAWAAAGLLERTRLLSVWKLAMQYCALRLPAAIPQATPESGGERYACPSTGRVWRVVGEAPGAGWAWEDELLRRSPLIYRCPRAGRLWRCLPDGAWSWEEDLEQPVSEETD